MSDRRAQPLKVLMIQTPQGVLKINLGAVADLPEPMARALRIFENAVDKGVLDPLAETLSRLQQMAAEGDEAPLAAALELMNRVMSEGMTTPRPPVPSLGTLNRLDLPENLN
ncbi:MAG: hypothetical protein HS108_11515 [Planctomycetes bacterium]|jgi:hypothetical protein|nr:hypothetical protein [Planctomycetota bacterium]MCL4730041.1 hypothetical protein [Planctomycetota bacterium]